MTVMEQSIVQRALGGNQMHISTIQMVRLHGPKPLHHQQCDNMHPKCFKQADGAAVMSDLHNKQRRVLFEVHVLILAQEEKPYCFSCECTTFELVCYTFLVLFSSQEGCHMV